ncbi:MAG: helix-hairpin-helix domain-containing protein [Burkholderiales bacterium]
MAAQAQPVIKTKADDLTLVEGIGPKIATVLANNGITTFAQLAKTDPAAIEEMLKQSGGRFNMARPKTWPQQAQLAAAGDFDALKKLQDELHGGIKK